MAAPAAPVTAAGVTAEELPAVVDDPAVGVAAAADAEDDEDDVVDDDASDVAPGTLSGAFGWPPSSGDGAILESVWRREIISGRQRRPPTCTGAPLPLKFASSAAVTAALSHFISEIYIISLHLLLLRAILLLLLASAATTSVSESVFLVDSEVSSSCAAAALLHKTADCTFSPSLTPFLFSLSHSHYCCLCLCVRSRALD